MNKTPKQETPRIACPSCGRNMQIKPDGIAGDYTAQCRNKKCYYDGWSAESLEQLVERERVSPIVTNDNWENLSQADQDAYTEQQQTGGGDAPRKAVKSYPCFMDESHTRTLYDDGSTSCASATSVRNAPRVTKEDGFRILGDNEIMQDGDQYYENGEWNEVAAEDFNIHVSDSGYDEVRRPIDQTGARNAGRVTYQAKVWLDKETSNGLWLLGGQKEVRSIFFDKRIDAKHWLVQCVKTNRGCSSLANTEIHGRIIESK